ncbi:hypothetical protein [Lysinibacillus sp. ZYM-1]|nr:hypothetical protein [Lysinibacillus sp. ZYM-1]
MEMVLILDTKIKVSGDLNTAGYVCPFLNRIPQPELFDACFS